jgi:hypothetical protein
MAKKMNPFLAKYENSKADKAADKKGAKAMPFGKKGKAPPFGRKK